MKEKSLKKKNEKRNIPGVQKESSAIQPLPDAYGNSPGAPSFDQGALPGAPLPQQEVYHQPPPAYQPNGHYESNPYQRQPARTLMFF